MLSPTFSTVPDEALPQHLTTHLTGLIQHAFEGASARTREQQLSLAARVVDALGADYELDNLVDDGKIRVLHELRRAQEPMAPPAERPQTPFSDVALLTNGQAEPSIGSEVRYELASADRVDLLCAFVKWHGLNRPGSGGGSDSTEGCRACQHHGSTPTSSANAPRG